jgi:hypothetical protein
MWLLIPFLMLPRLAAQPSFRIEPTGSLPSGVPAKMVLHLNPVGIRLVHTVNGLDQTLCELWWINDLPEHRQPGPHPGVLYPELSPGTFLGILSLPENLDDSNNRRLLPGLYTLRYALLTTEKKETKKEEGDGAVPPASPDTTGDFVLLSPLDADRSPRSMSSKRLTKLASAVSEGPLPAGIKLLPVNSAYRTLPALVSDDVGNCAVQVPLHAAGLSSPDSPVVALRLITPPNVSADD